MKKRKVKKAQITIFVIIAIVIIAIVVIIFYLNKNNLNNNTINPEIAPVYNYFEDCIKDSGMQSIKVIGLTGGNYKSELKTDSSISYYLYDGEKNTPSKENIEEEIDSLTEYFTGLCVANLSSFPEYEIKVGNLSSKTNVNENNVELNVESPVSIIKGGRTYKIKDFKGIEIPIRLGYILNASDEIVNENLNHPGTLCVNCLYEISKKYGLTVSVHDFDLDKSLIILTDNQSKIYEDNFALVFAVKYKNETQGSEIL